MNASLREGSPAAAACSTLKHDWLEHQIIRPLRAERSKWIIESDQPLPAMFASMGEWIKETRKFADEALEGYSPKQLVEQGPLGQLSEDIRLLIQQGVHQAYLDRQVVQPLIVELHSAIDSFEGAIELLMDAWTCEGRDRSPAIDAFEASVMRLRNALDRFPLGVVLW